MWRILLPILMMLAGGGTATAADVPPTAATIPEPPPADEPPAPAELERAGWHYFPADTAIAGACRPTALTPFPRLAKALERRFFPGLDPLRLAEIFQEHALFAWNPRRADSLRIVARLARPLTPAECADALPWLPGGPAAAPGGGVFWSGGPREPALALLEGGTLLLAARGAELRRALSEERSGAPRLSPELLEQAGSLLRPEPFWAAFDFAGGEWLRRGLAVAEPVLPPPDAPDAPDSPDAGVGGVVAVQPRIGVRAVFEAVDEEQARAIGELTGWLPMVAGVPAERIVVVGDGAARVASFWMTEDEILRVLGAVAADAPTEDARIITWFSSVF